MSQHQKKSIPVYLNIYDFTPLNCCLGWLGIGGYHTAIQIMNIEFCYSVIDNKPETPGVFGIQPQSAQYKFNRKVYLGETTLKYEQIQEIIDQLTNKYLCGNYHMFNNNCNHFSNELSMKILGKNIGHEYFRLTNFLSCVCCCLPEKCLNGQWAYEWVYGNQKQGTKIDESLIDTS